MAGILGLIVPILAVALSFTKKVRNLKKSTLNTFYFFGASCSILWIITVISPLDLKGIYTEELTFYLALFIVVV